MSLIIMVCHKKTIKCDHKKKNERAKKRLAYTKKYKNVINHHTNDIWIPPLDLEFNDLNIDSWFTIKKANANNKQTIGPILTKHSDCTQSKRAFKVILNLDLNQINIFNDWMNCYTKMYNETLKFIKEEKVRNGKFELDYSKLRTYYLKGKRDKIIRECLEGHNTKTFVHIIDTAIKLACANYKSAITNLKRGKIKHFRIRYWKYDRSSRCIEIEPSLFKSSIPKLLGSIKATYDDNDFNLDDIYKIYKGAVKLMYYRDSNQWCLWVPENIKVKKNKNTKKYVVLDPGIRRFMTGMSEDEMFFIGEKCTVKIKDYLVRKENIKKIPNKKHRKEKERLYNRKIENLVDDLHWKSINYLTNNYKHVLIGDMSVKGIVANDRSKLDRLTKVAALRLKFYKFRQRLENKCLLKNVTYKLIDEKYTSKMCSNCGWENITLGGADKFHCKDCKISLLRDANGCRGIYLKQWF